MERELIWEQKIERFELMRVFYRFDRAYGLIRSDCRLEVESAPPRVHSLPIPR